MSKSTIYLFGAILVTMLTGAACGDDDTPAHSSPTGPSAATLTDSAAGRVSNDLARNPRADGWSAPSGGSRGINTARDAPVRRATHHTTGWTFELLTDGQHSEHTNKFRVVIFSSAPETGDEGTHWYVQFRSIETYNGQPHERGVFVEAGQGDWVYGFWANARYVVRVRSYAKVHDHYYSIGENLIEVGRFTTQSCPSGTQHRDSEPHTENPYRCELIPEPPAPVVPDDPLPSGMITVAAADTWGATNNLSNFKVILTRNSGGTSYARIFIFHGGNACPATYTFRSGKYAPWPTNSSPRRNGCTHQSLL